MAIVSITKKSDQPKYKQIVTSIENAIVNGVLKKGDQLPSLNVVKNKHKVSRDTVLAAFKELKNRGIIHSVVGKGYYVSTEDIVVKQKVFLLFDEFNSFKEDLYNSFLENLDETFQVDIFFHHFNQEVLQKLINHSLGNYTYYVIMPANLTGVKNIIKELPEDRVYILDQVPKELEKYPAIYQDFKNDIQKGLQSGFTSIQKYKKIVLLFSPQKQPIQLLEGFKKFCVDFKINYEIIASIKDRVPKEGEIYIVFEDKNLIKIIKKIKETNLELSKNIGIISYNDTLLKEVVADGITTISTDFKLMGKQLAEMITTNRKESIANTSKLILRKSI
ncbi:GntR family transcriptional regulator [Polaribacter sp. WD7]|uniref:GntR family transcriptional regulator n=1 Tax=Polaribacter sp. WD7 TaxID=2269061 RepID=UPI000DF495DC|nr:GntR family transcriptional regulator [Polaribacter sp. WD7]RCS26148.1 GntR family transcriptional regulator [Polaribacter sp. WD7]